MRLVWRGKHGEKVTAKMLGYYAEQAAVAGFENSKVWENFKTCMIDAAPMMDSKDSIRVLKGISKVSEKYPSEHFKDLLEVTYRQIETYILSMSTRDLALIAEIAGKVKIINQSLAHALTVSFLTRIAEATPGEILSIVKNMKLLRVNSEIYNEIIKLLSTSYNLFPINDLLSIAFYCVEHDIGNLLNVISGKVAENTSKLSDDQIVKALYLYSTNNLQNPIASEFKPQNVSTELFPNLIFAFAVYKMDFRHLQNYLICHKILDNADLVSKLGIIFSLSLNYISTYTYNTFFKNNYSYFYNIFINIWKFCANNNLNNSTISLYLLETISLFGNIYSGIDNSNDNLGKLFNKVLKLLDKSSLSNEHSEVLEWVKSIVPYVWLDECDNADNEEAFDHNLEGSQCLLLKNLITLHNIASKCQIFNKDYPFDCSDNIDRLNPPFILPDLKEALQRIGEVEVIKFGKTKLLVMNRTCFVPLSPVHYIQGINGTSSDFEPPNSILRQNVKNGLVKLNKQYKVVPIIYSRWRRLTGVKERIGYINEIMASCCTI